MEEQKERDLINKYLIDDNISEKDGFDSSDESFEEDADSYKIEYRRNRK